MATYRGPSGRSEKKMDTHISGPFTSSHLLMKTCKLTLRKYTSSFTRATKVPTGSWWNRHMRSARPDGESSKSLSKFTSMIQPSTSEWRLWANSRWARRMNFSAYAELYFFVILGPLHSTISWSCSNPHRPTLRSSWTSTARSCPHLL